MSSTCLWLKEQFKDDVADLVIVTTGKHPGVLQRMVQ